jgi:hypothetical protein
MALALSTPGFINKLRLSSHLFSPQRNSVGRFQAGLTPEISPEKRLWG